MSSSSIRSLCQIALFAAIIAVCSQIQIPLTVPFTMQTFAVFSALAILGGKNGTISILIYIALGAIGIPVFAGFSGGIGVLFGTTGGYILGFLFSGLLYWLITHFLGTKLPVMIAAMALSLVHSSLYQQGGIHWTDGCSGLVCIPVYPAGLRKDCTGNSHCKAVAKTVRLSGRCYKKRCSCINSAPIMGFVPAFFADMVTVPTSPNI